MTQKMNNPAFATTLSQPNLPPSFPTTTHVPSPPTTTKTKPLNFRTPANHLDATISWTSSISRRCRAGDLAGAAEDFTRMRLADAEPNHVTLITLLSGCAHSPAGIASFGASVHAYARKLGLDTGNVKLGTALVDMYSKCGLVDLARRSFDEIPAKNSMSWNSMIDGYMRSARVEDAVLLFDEMPQRDAISWTALISGFVKQGLYAEALNWFREMQLNGFEPDYVTIISVIAACANLGALNLGLWTNRFILKKNFRDNIRISNSLIDMYCHCGCIDFTKEIFDEMPSHSVVSWNSIINGFASNGHAEDALKYFDLMQSQGLNPDGVTFTGALSACSHAGLVKNGLKIFDQMQRKNRIRPRIEHYGCLVDLYSRTGQLQDVFNVITKMPMEPNEVVLGSLLAACKESDDVGLAEMLMDYIADVAPGCDSNYVMLANLYAAGGKWEGSGKIRRKMKAQGIVKTPGISIIEIGDSVHEFVAGDTSHLEVESICEMLDLLSIQLMMYGYVPHLLQNYEKKRVG